MSRFLCGIFDNVGHYFPDNFLRKNRMDGNTFRLVCVVSLCLSLTRQSEQRDGNPRNEGEASEIESELEHGYNVLPTGRKIKSLA